MTRLAELQKKYPTIHKDVIVKWEMASTRVRDSKDLDKASNWRQLSRGLYLSNDDEWTLERLKRETPWRVREDGVLTPGLLLTRTGFGFVLERRDRSPYEIREIEEGKVALFEGEEMVDVDLFFPGARGGKSQGPSRLTSKGTPIEDLVEISGPTFRIYPTRFCQYFNTGEQCKFCNLNPSEAEIRAAGYRRPINLNIAETMEALKIYGSETTLLEGSFVSGGYTTSGSEADATLRWVEAVNRTLPYRTDMKLVAEAMSRKDLLRLKEGGLTGVRFQMEIWDERLFPLINPGKTRHMPREGWLEAFQDAVEIFGVGKVAAKFIGGMGLMGPFGYQRWQDARDSEIEGDRWMISHGVYPCFDAFRLATGSEFAKDPANREKFAPSELFLDRIASHHDAMKEYDLYEKMSRLLYPILSGSATIYVADMGIIELAGDVGKWNEAIVPIEQNWIGRFIQSIKAPEENQSKTEAGTTVC